MVAAVPSGDRRGPRHTSSAANVAATALMATDSARRLHHAIPPWVAGGSVFHIRLRAERAWASLTRSLITAPARGNALLDSVAHYHRQRCWYCHLFLLMPDHTHALLAFPYDKETSRVIGGWKSWRARHSAIEWQDNFFDHRIRNRSELERKAIYIRNNPVVKGLCPRAEDWPWVIDSAALEAPSGTPAPTPR
ncbi:MAG: hypothetical protein C0502_07020 [Opitutus sp.]|nr:hypothetical protein [Opitutus sp.]